MKGIRETPFGRQAYVRVYGKQYSKRFPTGTSDRALQEWRTRKIAALKYGAPTPEDAPTFADDAREYLRLVADMPTYRERAYHIGWWVRQFGPRPRATITAREIRAALATRADDAPSTRNHYRTALLHLYTTLDGKSARNPVRDVPRADDSASADIIRARPLGQWYRLLARLRRYSRTRARLRVMLWTGLPHALLGQLRPADVDLQHATMRVARRKKGTGTKAITLPLVPPAVVAFKEFHRADAWGPFSASSMHAAVRRALAKENQHRARLGLAPWPPIRPYDARHTFASLLAGVLTDDAMVEVFLLSRQPRYRTGALEARLRAAAEILTGTFGTLSPRSPASGVVTRHPTLAENTRKTGAPGRN